MTTTHLSDDMIQQFALEAQGIDEPSETHIAGCKYCQLRAENYRVLFTRVAQQPPATFDFDISALVLNQLPPAGINRMATLPQPTPARVRASRGKSTLAIVVACMFLTGAISAALYFMQDYFGDILSGLSIMITYLIIITVLLVLGFLVYDEYVKHNKQIDSLDFNP